jgi:hypothetical protein
MDDKTIVTLAVTIGLTFIGYIVKYLNDVSVARRKDKLERINQQLRNLYGPLYTTTQANGSAWRAFRSRYRPGKSFFGSQPPPNEEELAAWRLWMSEVFMPLNLRLEKIIVENGDLIIEEEMPACFLNLCAHVAAYKPVIKRWESGDYQEFLSLSLFPDDLGRYAEVSYTQLKGEQAKLLGTLGEKSGAQ